MSATPFTDPDLVAGPLYATASRLAQRTGALHATKISGGDATATIAARFAAPSPVVCDIGCGRGTTTLQGTVHIIDFEHARYDLAARDLVRLADRIWRDRPDLEDAFLARYGSFLTPRPTTTTREPTDDGCRVAGASHVLELHRIPEVSLVSTENITVLGSGYVGLTTGVCLASLQCTSLNDHHGWYFTGAAC